MPSLLSSDSLPSDGLFDDVIDSEEFLAEKACAWARAIFPYALALHMDEAWHFSRLGAWEHVPSAFILIREEATFRARSCRGMDIDMFTDTLPDSATMTPRGYVRARRRYETRTESARMVCAQCPIRMICATEGVRYSLIDHDDGVRRFRECLERIDAKRVSRVGGRSSHPNALRSVAVRMMEDPAQRFPGVYGGLDVEDRARVAGVLCDMLERYWWGRRSIEDGLDDGSPQWRGMSRMEVLGWTNRANAIRDHAFSPSTEEVW